MTNILSALNAIDVASLSYQEWVSVGMALHSEGFDCSVWDSWSRNDRRYHAGECERKWRTFSDVSTPVTGGTIVQIAKAHGWTYKNEDGIMDWSDSILEDGDGFTPYNAPQTESPVNQLITYIETLYEKDDLVGYVTTDVWQDDEGRWLPKKGVYDRTAGELISSLKKHPDDLGATIGDWKKECGAFYL